MDDPIDLAAVLPRFGWSAPRKALVDLAGRATVEGALRSGTLVVVAHGRYALPESVGPAQVAAIRVNGVVSHLSAAMRHGLAVRQGPPFPTVTVPRGRNLSRARRLGVRIHWADLDPGDVDGGVTTPLRTVLDCAATLPYAEALVVADSALAQGMVAPDELLVRAGRMPACCRERVMHVVLTADARPQSAFESLVRGHAADVPRLCLEPQVEVGTMHPDLLDRRLGMAVECDSFEHHSKRADLLADCERYNDFALLGLLLIRFGWEHSMNRPDYIRSTLTRAVVVRERQLGIGEDV